LWGVGAHW